MNKLVKPVRTNILWSSSIFFLMVLAYAYIYYYTPFSEKFSPYVNDKILDTMTLIPALMTAFTGIKITRQFEYDEPPFRIWLIFTLGWCSWTCGELSGFVYDYFYPDIYFDFSFTDVCWLMGYFFFGLSLYYQFRLIYSAKKGRQSVLYLAYIALGLVVTLGLTRLAIYAGLGEDSSWWIVYLAVLYPVFDLTEGIGALWLSFLFGRGALGRAWWGLIAFAVADSINIFFWLGGYNWVSDQAYVILDTFSNVVYLMGYMITAMAFLVAYNLMHHGVSRKTSALQIES